MKRTFLVLAVLCLLTGGCATTHWPIVEKCEAPEGSEVYPHLIFRNGQLMSSHGMEPADTCRMAGAQGPAPAPEREAVLQALVENGCGGETYDDMSDWMMRSFASENGHYSVSSVMESGKALHLMGSSSSGGMPSGALQVDQWTVVFPPTDKPVEQCTTTIRHKPYHGPMPA